MSRTSTGDKLSAAQVCVAPEYFQRDSSLGHLMQSNFLSLMAKNIFGSTSEWGAEPLPVQGTGSLASFGSFRHGC